MRTRKTTIPMAVLAAVLFGLGPGTGVGSAKPMEREDQRYCAKIVKDYETTRRIYADYHRRFGPNDALTIQASSNHARAAEAWVNAAC